MLSFLNKARALNSQASQLYKAIEKEYSHKTIGDNSYVVHTPMNIPAGTEGYSDKPWHHNSYELARSAFYVLNSTPTNYENYLYQGLVKIEQFQSEHATGADNNGFPMILAKFEAARIELVKLCQEMVLEIARFKGRFVTTHKLSADLINYFAEKLVDENKFGCTPQLFKTMELNLRRRNDQEIETPRCDIPYWLELDESFSHLVTPRSFKFDSKMNSFVADLGTESERANSLAYLLSSRFTGEEISALKKAVDQKFQLLQSSKATDVVVSETRAPVVVHAFVAAQLDAKRVSSAVDGTDAKRRRTPI